MKMKAAVSKISLILVIFLFFASNLSFSQEISNKKTPEERAQKITERMKTNLKLDESQSQKIYTLFLNHFNAVKTLKESNQGADKSAIKEKMKDNRKELKEGIRNTLTDEQFKQLKHNAKMHCRHHKRYH